MYTKPVKVGDVIEVEISNKGKMGDGVARIGNSEFVVIIPETEIGKTYKVRIERVFEAFSIGKVIK